MSDDIVLYDYWRSSASYRVRIALNMLELEHETVAVDLTRHEHREAPNLQRNKQGLVPTLAMDGRFLTQSLAIIEYLDEVYPAAGFLPHVPWERQRVRALSHAIAMDIHPVCNMSVVVHVMGLAADGEAARLEWMRTFIGGGLTAFEAMLAGYGTGLFCHGDRPGMADFCLVPQVYNARRWGVEIDHLGRIGAIVDRCMAIDAFIAAHPDNVKPPAATTPPRRP
ncbi:maleylacetoacetate isomerase [Phyllobacterium sp. 0TCS1.6C]|uniref:maleylacetoacetate isomerase n=1 Tax=unclassified Phyllobacterium TaxID=2638441 RepID=UPI0022648DDD|nr:MULTISPECIES: maleylacetoacetate isomerase [unclassified Phyllobacterium]MCX8279736.1 maleylacetoacetate isomerase [Phyllobacterium sp. 0TCS1.6C]MCX8295660.1 maleylacetoacetate isomerase [Phyllobacterium sp. 0TCS1.6A]